MVEEKVTVINDIGLHARPASLFLREAIKYSSDVVLIKDDREFNGKSIISILAMSAKKGTEIIVRCEGEDEEEALSNLIFLIKNKLEV